MTNVSTISLIPPAASMETARQDVRNSFERFCLTAGVGVLEQLLQEDAEHLAGPRHGRHPERAGRPSGGIKPLITKQMEQLGEA
jgi:putative transposase